MKEEFKIETEEVKVFQKTKKVIYKENHTVYERRVMIEPTEQVRLRLYEIQENKKSYLQIGSPRGYVTIKVKNRESVWTLITELMKTYCYLSDNNLLNDK